LEPHNEVEKSPEQLLLSSYSRFDWAIPESFAFYKSIFTLSFDISNILFVGISMNRNKKIQFFAALKLFTKPTTFNFFLLRAHPDFAERGTPTVSAAFSATELHHCTKNFVALLIILEILAKSEPRNKLSEFIISCLPKFLSQISCKVWNSPLKPWQSPQ
jgi:hypothetical protein